MQDYRDAKLRDLAKTTKALNVKINSLREANEQKVKELAAAQLKADQLLRKQERRAEDQHKRQQQQQQQQQQQNGSHGAGDEAALSPKQQKLRAMRTAVQDANRRVEMLNLRGESCARKAEACAAVLRNELGIGPDEELPDLEALLKDGGPAAAKRKQTAEELTMLQTEVRGGGTGAVGRRRCAVWFGALRCGAVHAGRPRV